MLKYKGKCKKNEQLVFFLYLYLRFSSTRKVVPRPTSELFT